MTSEQNTALHDFEALVRQLMKAYKAACEKNKALAEQVSALTAELEAVRKTLEQSRHDYDVLKTARMLEVSGEDVKQSRARLSKLIREVDKCIALLSV